MELRFVRGEEPAAGAIAPAARGGEAPKVPRVDSGFQASALSTIAAAVAKVTTGSAQDRTK
jgi:hypothetical protein